MAGSVTRLRFRKEGNQLPFIEQDCRRKLSLIPTTAKAIASQDILANHLEVCIDAWANRVFIPVVSAGFDGFPARLVFLNMQGESFLEPC